MPITDIHIFFRQLVDSCWPASAAVEGFADSSIILEQEHDHVDDVVD
jgi:hypothetical protein